MKGDAIQPLDTAFAPILSGKACSEFSAWWSVGVIILPKFSTYVAAFPEKKALQDLK